MLTDDDIRRIRAQALATRNMFLSDLCDAGLREPDADGCVEGPAGGSCFLADIKRLIVKIESGRS